MSEVRALQAQLRAEGRALPPPPPPPRGSTQVQETHSGDHTATDSPGGQPVGVAVCPAAGMQQPREAMLWLRTHGARIAVQPASSSAASHPRGQHTCTLVRASAQAAQAAQQPGSGAHDGPGGSFAEQLQLGPMLGRGATSVVYAGTWRTTAVAVKEVVVQQEDGPDPAAASAAAAAAAEYALQAGAKGAAPPCGQLQVRASAAACCMHRRMRACF